MKNNRRYNNRRFHSYYSGTTNTYIRSNIHRKKSKKPLIAVISILLIFCVAFTMFYMFGGMSLLALGDFKDYGNKAAFIDSSKTKHMSFNNEKYESKSVENEGYIINYPFTDIEELDSQIENEVKHLAECAKSSSATFTVFDYITEIADNKYLSVVFRSTEYDLDKNKSGGDVFTKIFDLSSKKEMKTDDVFKSNFYEFASEYVRNYFNNNIDTKKLVSEESFKSATTADKLHFENFSINNKQCTLYFSQKTLFRNGYNIYDISVSLSEISDYLNISLKEAVESKDFSKNSNIRTDLDPQKPMIAITFDDGPHYSNTEKILNILKANNSRATFFVVGDNAVAYPDILKKISDSGCQIGNHTKDHRNLTKLSEKEIKEEADYVDRAVKEATGKPTTALRPPYGAYNEKVEKILNKTPLIFWDVDTEDWSLLNTKKTIDSVMNQASDGAILLLHDIHNTTAEAAETFIPRLVANGYQLVTVEELLYYKDVKVKGGETYPW